MSMDQLISLLCNLPEKFLNDDFISWLISDSKF